MHFSAMFMARRAFLEEIRVFYEGDQMAVTDPDEYDEEVFLALMMKFLPPSFF